MSNLINECASKDANIEIIKALLSTDINARNSDNCTALYYAVLNCRIDIVQLLIEAGADINITNKYNETALICACRKNSIEITELLLRSGAAVNHQTRSTSAMEEACKNNSINIVKLLLKYKVDLINLPYKSLKFEIITLLLQAGAKFTNLMNFIKSNADINIIKLLLDSGIQVNTYDSKYDTTPLIYACSKNNIKLIKLLIRYNADVNFRGDRDDYPLEISNNLKIVKLLLETNKCNRESINISLMHACYSGIESVVKILLEYNADPNYSELMPNPLTIHINNCSKVNHNIISTLLQAGADPNLKDKNKFTPLSSAIKKDLETIKLLVEAGAKNINDVISCTDKVEIVSYLLDKCADINNVDLFKVKNVELFKFIIQAGFKASDDEFFRVACTMNHIDIINYLIYDAGLNINAGYGEKNTTFLMIACKCDNIRAIKALLRAGADRLIKDASNQTALYYTKTTEARKLVRSFIDIDKVKKCTSCFEESNKNILLYLTYECPVCVEKVDRIVALGCGHINCCQTCFIDP